MTMRIANSMDYKAQTIKNRLSLRQPQADSLEILTKLTETLELVKDASVTDALVKVRALYPTCADFERGFPSVCFSLATTASGVWQFDASGNLSDLCACGCASGELAVV